VIIVTKTLPCGGISLGGTPLASGPLGGDVIPMPNIGLMIPIVHSEVITARSIFGPSKFTLMWISMP
jgi:hypothetical protein